MSLKTDYYDGETGLHTQLNNAYDAGIAFVGSGSAEKDTLDLGNNTGTLLTQGIGIAGLYFDTPVSNGTVYRNWYYVNGEIAPPTPLSTYILNQIVILSADNASVIAIKTATSLNALTNEPFNAYANASVVTIINSMDGALPSPISIGTLDSSAATDPAAVAQVVAGVNPSGSFPTLQNALISYAAQGITDFVVVIATSYNPVYLRGNNGGRSNQYGVNNNNLIAPFGSYGSNTYPNTGNSNVPAREGNNFLLRAYLAGIQAGLADQNIYDYECSLSLNTEDNVTTSINFHFHFQTT